MNLNKFTKEELLEFLSIHGVSNKGLSSKSKEQLVKIAQNMLKDIAEISSDNEDEDVDKAIDDEYYRDSEIRNALMGRDTVVPEDIDYIYDDETRGVTVYLTFTTTEKGQSYWKASSDQGNYRSTVTRAEMEYMLSYGLVHPAPLKKATKSKAAKDFNPKLINTSIEPDILVSMIKTALDKGTEEAITLLFHGVPGTGKTQVSHYLGDTLGLKVVKRNISDIVSKYVGETERALAKAFKEADGGILHIDEFDSLAGDRDDADRNYQVSHTNSFLQAIDDFNGILVVTTNRMSDVDNAILRRFLLKTEFHNLTAKQAKMAAKHFFPEYKLELGAGKYAPADFALVRRSLIFVEDKKITNEFLVQRIREEAAYRSGYNPDSITPMNFLKGDK
jgi:hypothetical protein